MFTGLIEEMGEVVRAVDEAGGRRLRVHAPRVARDLERGASVAINGVCQTVTTLPGPDQFEVLAVAETLRRTTIAGLAAGRHVNLELSLRAGDRLGGHWVNGHVDCTTTIEEMRRSGADARFLFGLPPVLARYVVEKGSIAVDGVSLTVGGVTPSTFEVFVIPETRARTLFGRYAVGDRVNLEADILAKYVEGALGLDPLRDAPRAAAAWGSESARRVFEAWERGEG